MSARPFVHLHCHTHYSLLDGFNRIPELVTQTKKLGMNACAITDHGNLYGAIEFYTACRSAGLNPILGYEAYVAPGDCRDKKKHPSGDNYYHLTLLAKNSTGFRNLIKLSSIAFLEGFYYAPRIDLNLLEQFHEGLIVLSGCLAGAMNQFILKNQIHKAEELIRWYVNVFGEDFYLEIQNNGLAMQDICTAETIRLADRLGIPMVATADAHYLCAEDATAHDVLFCINTNRKHDPRKRSYPEESIPNPYYVRSPEDMYRLFPQCADAVARSQDIANKCDVQMDFTRRHFPVFAAPNKLSAEDYLRELCRQGCRERYADQLSQAVWDRLEHELDVIIRMGFAGYFLIVWDFVRFAREQGIPCTARGSGCGSIVAYALYISHVCPLKYDLLFERFLDPNRNEPPDIDIDFCQERREMVINYVKEKYGKDSVAQIGTFGTLAAKAALKDVGRVLDIPLERVNQLCKLVPMKGAIAMELKDALEMPDFKREYTSDPQTRTWIDIAKKLEGTNRNVGTHAAGVVIANGPITDFVPVQRTARKSDGEEGAADAAITTQWEMGALEKVGMLKMDFLGLRNLTVLDNAVKLIRKTRGLDIDPYQFPLDDKKTFELLQRGDAKGVFQLESEGMRELLKRMKPDNIRDLIAVLALYRPGPLGGGMVDSYVNRKHGCETWDYPHPVLKEILDETYGVMVYQEQIMRILNRLGGIELSKAYACIKAISKKVQEKIDATRSDFVRGCGERGVNTNVAEDIFEKIIYFAGYGFNKSHTAAYAQIGYQTAYLKANFTPEFMAALLTSEIDDGNKRDVMVDHIADARKLGVEVLPPDINSGEAHFNVVNGKIIFGLAAIKGVGAAAVNEIVRARQQQGRFRDLFDFAERVDTRLVTRAAVEKLIKAGAMDAFGRRAALLLSVANAFDAAETRHQDRRRGQRSFFDMIEGEQETENQLGVQHGLGYGLPDVPEWSEVEKLKYEKEALDFYISSHPLAQYEEQLRRFRGTDACQVHRLANGTHVLLAGMVVNFQMRTAQKSGKRWAMFQIEDFSGQCKAILWSEEYQRFKEDVQDDAILIFEGSVERRDLGGAGDLIVKRILTPAQAQREMTKALLLRMPYSDDPTAVAKLDRIKSLLSDSLGTVPVYLSVSDPDGRKAQFKLSKELMVNPQQLPIETLEMLLGPGTVIFTR